MSSIKEKAIRLIQELPDDCTLTDIRYHLYVHMKLEQAMAKIDDGEGLSQEESERKVAEWLDHLVENDPSFAKRIAKARQDIQAGRGIRLEDVDSLLKNDES